MFYTSIHVEVRDYKFFENWINFLSLIKLRKSVLGKDVRGVMDLTLFVRFFKRIDVQQTPAIYYRIFFLTNSIRKSRVIKFLDVT